MLDLIDNFDGDVNEFSIESVNLYGFCNLISIRSENSNVMSFVSKLV